MNAIVKLQYGINTTAASVACNTYSESVKMTTGEIVTGRFFTSHPHNPNHSTVLVVNDGDSAMSRIIKKIPTMDQKGLVFFK